jgi:uncharacterized protein YchJ
MEITTLQELFKVFEKILDYAYGLSKEPLVKLNSLSIYNPQPAHLLEDVYAEEVVDEVEYIQYYMIEVWYVLDKIALCKETVEGITEDDVKLAILSEGLAEDLENANDKADEITEFLDYPDNIEIEEEGSYYILENQDYNELKMKFEYIQNCILTVKRILEETRNSFEDKPLTILKHLELDFSRVVKVLEEIEVEKSMKSQKKTKYYRKKVFQPKIEKPKQEPRRVHKVGRNEACPCGSGKKYKNCCGSR